MEKKPNYLICKEYFNTISCKDFKFRFCTLKVKETDKYPSQNYLKAKFCSTNAIKSISAIEYYLIKAKVNK